MNKLQFKILLFFYALTIIYSPLLAQERTGLMHFQLFQTGKLNYQTTTDSGTTKHANYTRMFHPTVEMLYENELWYINGNALAVLLSYFFKDNIIKTTNLPALEFGWGWHLNREHPLRLGSDANILLGIGFNLGVSSFKAFGPPKASGTPAYIGPTLGVNIQVGKRFNIQNVAELNVFRENIRKDSGTRLEIRSNINYQIIKGFSLSIIPTLQNFKSKSKSEGTQSANFISARKFKLQFLQFGFGFSF